MKILVLGDLHITHKCPENRVDDYEKTTLSKFVFGMEAAKKENCDLIIQPGDFFNEPNPPYSLFTEVINIIKNYNTEIICCYGQHDLKFRNKENTALSALFASCPNVSLGPTGDKDVLVQGCGYDEEVPEPAKSRYNVLIIHKMIVEDKLWATQDNFEWSTAFLRRNKFDLIVSGDNHQFFHANNGDRYLFNCGSLLRSSISQVDHKPRIIIFDTEKPHKFKTINVPIEPASKVFAMDKVMKEKEKDEKLAAFVDGLSKQKDMGLSFVDNLNKYLSSNNVDKAVKQIIKDSMV